MIIKQILYNNYTNLNFIILPIILLRFAIMKRFGLELDKDAGYSKLIVGTAALLSGTIFAPGVFMGVLTAQWKAEFGLGQALARNKSRTFQRSCFLDRTLAL